MRSLPGRVLPEGDQCPFVHMQNWRHTPTKAWPQGSDITGIKEVKDVPCPFLRKPGGCNHGATCKFNHDAPPKAEAPVPSAAAVPSCFSDLYDLYGMDWALDTGTGVRPGNVPAG